MEATSAPRSWSALRYFFFLLWLSLVFSASLFLFTNGFLLTRLVLEQKSNETAGPATFSKAVILIVDALRYDFARWNYDCANTSDDRHFTNQLPYLRELQENKSAKLFEFIADPPTTTLQRLKGLTTGGLPTFIDVSSNFASSDIGEDNVIQQLAEAGKKIVFTGDDTWTGLFPPQSKAFTEAYPYPSFDVWDLDTVDRGVDKHLAEVLTRPEDWDVLIAHYLGVDHAGHKFGPRHPEMARKLGEVDRALRKLVPLLDDDCLLLVAGDHGMTSTGDHGGDSLDEVRAALVAYSKRFAFKRKEGTEPIAQVDFAPTLALLLGVPIPYSSLGRIIPDLFFGDNEGPAEATEAASLLEANVNQVQRYLQQYVESGGKLPVDMTAKIEKNAADFRAISPSSPAKMRHGLELLADVREALRSVWARFDEELIATGIIVTVLQLATTLVLLQTPRSRLLTSIINSSLISYLFVLGLAGSLGGLASNVGRANANEWTVGLGAAVSAMTFGFFILWKLSRSIDSILASLVRNLCQGASMTLSGLLAVCAFISAFSNSFVVQEAQIASFLTVSFVVMQLWTLRQPLREEKPRNQPLISVKLRISSGPSKNTRLVLQALLLCGLIRLSNVYFRCREEQAPHCLQTEHHKPLSTLPRGADYAVYRYYRGASTFLAATLGLMLPRRWLSSCGNLNGDSPAVTAVSHLPTFAFVCTVSFWALQAQDPNLRLVPEWKSDLLVPASILLQLVLLACLTVSPRMIHRMRKVNFGLGTALSAPLVSVTCYVLAPITCLLLGDGLAPAVVLAMACVAVYLAFSTALRLERAAVSPTRVADLLEVPWDHVFGWWLLQELFFYATGHQATFTTIHWHAAFVGFSGSNYGSSDASASFLASVALPAVLIGWNTFATRLVFALALPGLVLAPLTLWLTCPSIRRHFLAGVEGNPIDSFSADEDLDRGEVFVLKRPEEAKTQVFKAYCKFMCLTTFRLVSTMISSMLLRRHLMVWKIFAPRFVFEGVGYLVSLASILLGYIFFARILVVMTRFYRKLEVEVR